MVSSSRPVHQGPSMPSQGIYALFRKPISTSRFTYLNLAEIMRIIEQCMESLLRIWDSVLIQLPFNMYYLI